MKLFEETWNNVVEGPPTDKGMAGALIAAGIPKKQAFKAVEDAAKYLSSVWVDKSPDYIDSVVNGADGWTFGKLMAKAKVFSFIQWLNQNPTVKKKILNW